MTSKNIILRFHSDKFEEPDILYKQFDSVAGFFKRRYGFNDAYITIGTVDDDYVLNQARVKYTLL